MSTGTALRAVGHALLVSIATLSIACGGGEGEEGSTDPAQAEPVTASLSATTLLLGVGQTKTVTINVTRPEYKNSAVTLGVENLPTGVTATFNPAAVTGRTASSTLTLAAAPDASPTIRDVFLTVTGASRAAGLVGEPPSISVTVYGPSVGVTRAGSGSGTVVSSPAGINCGNVCTATFSALPLTLTASPAAGSTFTGWSGACVATTPTCVFTPSVTASNAVVATFAAPSFVMAVSPTSISVPQGSSAPAAVTITRSGGFSGAVNLSVSGAPAGLTITPSPTSITAESATLTVTAAAALGVGNYPITLLATGAGVSQQTVTVPVVVTPSTVGTGNITASFAACDPTLVPIWFAVQTGNGAWTRIPVGTNNTFTFGFPSPGGGVAYVTGSGGRFATTVLYLSAAEATAIATGSICAVNAQTGTRTLTTNALNTGSQNVTVTLGGASTTFNNPTPPTGGIRFTLENFPAGRRDLIAARSIIQGNGQTQLQKMVLRRNTAYNVSAFPPSIDFAGAESFAPVLHGFTLSNLAGDRSSVSESFLSTNGSSETFFESIGSFNAASATDFVPFYTLPDSLLAADDFHSLFIAAEPQGGNTNSGRFAILLLHTSASQIAGSVTFGPKLTTPTVTSLGATPNVRMRAQLPLQTAYSAAASAGFSQGDNIVVNVTVTAGYSSGAPTTWTLDVPDLSSAGYDAAWGLKNDSPVTWNVVGLGGSVLPLLGASPVDGMVAVAGIVFSPSASTQLGRWRRAGLPVYRLTLPR